MSTVVVITSHTAEHCVRHSFVVSGVGSKSKLGGTYRQHGCPHYPNFSKIRKLLHSERSKTGTDVNHYGREHSDSLFFDMQRILTELEHSQNAYDHERRIVPCKYSNSARKEKLHQNSNESLLIKMRHQNSDT